MRQTLQSAAFGVALGLVLGVSFPSPAPSPTQPPQAAYEAVWKLECFRGHGTGFAVAQVGNRVWMATARHVAEDLLNPILRACQDDRWLYFPKVEWLDDAHDLALVSFVTNRDETLLRLNDGPPPRLGDPVWTIGYPLRAGFRIGTGCWSGGSRITAPTHFGNSGGPVVDVHGTVVGVVSQIRIAPTYMGDGAAVPHLTEIEPVGDIRFRLDQLQAAVRIAR